MRSTAKMRDLTLRNMILLVTYIAGLILFVVNFKVVVSFVGTFFSIIKPFLIGIVLAFVFNIPMKLFIRKLPIENEKTKKIVAAILAVLLVLSVFAIAIIVVLPQVVENVKVLIENLPNIFNTIEEWISYAIQRFDIPKDVAERIESMQEGMGDTVVNTITSWGPSIAAGFTQFTTGIINFFLGFVMAVYMLFSKDKLLRQAKKFGQAFLNDKQFLQANDFIHLTIDTFENFLAGQLTEAVIIGVLCYIGCIILKIPYASIAAVLIGVTNIIPYFGPIIGAVLSSMLIIFVSPVKTLVFLIFSTLLQQFESNIIYPHVVGGSVGLSALWVLFAVTAGGGLFGIPGMIFGLPTFSVIYELLRRKTNQRIKEKELEKEKAVPDV